MSLLEQQKDLQKKLIKAYPIGTKHNVLLPNGDIKQGQVLNYDIEYDMGFANGVNFKLEDGHQLIIPNYLLIARELNDLADMLHIIKNSDMASIFKKSRIQIGYNTQELANELGISRTLISKIENGVRNPQPDLVIKFNKLYKKLLRGKDL